MSERGGRVRKGHKFRASGTQETMEGSGANEVSGVFSEASRCKAPLILNEEADPF